MDGSLSVSQGSTNLVSVIGDADLYDQSHSGGTYNTSLLEYSTNAGTDYNSGTVNVAGTSLDGYDTGDLVLNFDAVVGDTYKVFLGLDVGSTSDGGAQSIADFSHTLAASITPSDGEEIVHWDVQPSNVPVPAGSLLLAPGLVAIAAIRRRLTK